MESSDKPRAPRNRTLTLTPSERRQLAGALLCPPRDGRSAFKDKVSNYCVVDVKTHREGTAFNMPNLTSVDRLARFYEDDSNYFVMLMIKYAVVGTKV